MFRIRNPAPSKPNSDDGGDSRGCHLTAAKWILPRKKGSCALLWSWPFMIFRCQGGRCKGQGWSVCENKIGGQTSVRVRTGRFWDSTERALGGGMQGMGCGRGQNILCWLGGITSPCNVSHHSHSQERVSKPELPSPSIHIPHLDQRMIQLYQPLPQIHDMSPEKGSIVAVLWAVECVWIVNFVGAGRRIVDKNLVIDTSSRSLVV